MGFAVTSGLQQWFQWVFKRNCHGFTFRGRQKLGLFEWWWNPSLWLTFTTVHSDWLVMGLLNGHDLVDENQQQPKKYVLQNREPSTQCGFRGTSFNWNFLLTNHTLLHVEAGTFLRSMANMIHSLRPRPISTSKYLPSGAERANLVNLLLFFDTGIL